MHRFNVGDRVVTVVEGATINRHLKTGTTGTVCYSGDNSIGVRWDFDKPRYWGHSCAGRCEYGFGWFVFPSDIEHISNSLLEDVEDSEFETILGVGGTDE